MTSPACSSSSTAPPTAIRPWIARSRHAETGSFGKRDRVGRRFVHRLPAAGAAGLTPARARAALSHFPAALTWCALLLAAGPRLAAAAAHHHHRPVAHALGVSSRGQAGRRPAGALRVSVGGRWRAVPQSYLGLSVEYNELPQYEALPGFARLLADLQVPGDGPVVLRVGGGSGDMTYFRTLGPAGEHQVPDRYLSRL